MKRILSLSLLIAFCLMINAVSASSEIPATEKCSYCSTLDESNMQDFDASKCTCTKGCPCAADRCPCFRRRCCNRRGKLVRPHGMPGSHVHPNLPHNVQSAQ